MLGWPVSAHPWRPFAEALAARGVVHQRLLVENAGDRVMVAGARLRYWGERRGHLVLQDEAGVFRLQVADGKGLLPAPWGDWDLTRHGPRAVDRAGEATITVERDRAAVDGCYLLSMAG